MSGLAIFTIVAVVVAIAVVLEAAITWLGRAKVVTARHLRWFRPAERSDERRPPMSLVDDVRPGELGTVMALEGDVDHVAVTIVDLAVRGHLHIHERSPAEDGAERD